MALVRSGGGVISLFGPAGGVSAAEGERRVAGADVPGVGGSKEC